MVATNQKPAKKPKTLDDIELHPDAWARFEGFVKAKIRTRSAAKPTASRPKAARRKAKKPA